MTPGHTKYTKAPRYHGLRIYLVSTVMYFFLVFPVAGILLFKYVPDYLKRSNTPNPEGINLKLADGTIEMTARNDSIPADTALLSDSLSMLADSLAAVPETPGNITTVEGNNQIGGTMALLVRLLLVSFILGFAFNLPFKNYFRRKRKGLPVKPGIQQFCKRFLLKSPLINTGIMGLSFTITIIYMLYIIALKKDVDEVNQRFYFQFFFITLLSSILTLMLIYFWMKHRVHIRYLEHVFTEHELRKRIFKLRSGRIRNRLWVSGAMTTLLPLIIVIFYLLLSITSVKELEVSSMSADQVRILLGKYETIDLGITAENLDGFFYVNAINSLLMVIGISTGIMIALIYIVLFVRWTTEDIVRPVKELLDNMERAGQGDLESFSIVRTNDEIGELTEGYNEMADRLKTYFHSLDRINKANSRFVPRQFLEFLGKDSITEIQLGDQVQKEMTIMFSDIRDFTSLSETMSPKENFDFINNYLGYMEPVIRNNNGFIDKFMGDSIMALFPESAEDAINTAIEMRIKMLEYNQIISQFGKPAIDAGIGIHTGLLMLGIIGGEGRMDGTVISDAVNLTARLEGLTKIYGSSIIITEDTLIKLSDPSQYQFRFLDIVKVKGKKEAIYIFEIMDGEPDEVRDLKILTKDDYNKAVQAYKKKEFGQALRVFQKLEALNPADKALRIYMERCRHYSEKGVPEIWDGVESFDHKF
jgi:class 3 adenylate cyclase